MKTFELIFILNFISPQTRVLHRGSGSQATVTNFEI